MEFKSGPITEIERIDPLIDKDALNELIAQQRLILEMHQQIVRALASPAFYMPPTSSKNPSNAGEVK